MTKDLKHLAYRISGKLDCRLAFRASEDEKLLLMGECEKHGLSLGEYVLALLRHYHQEKR